ncbi:hypothetical protein [Klebsiella variicola]|uniref:hypothetical protein n=1 Tax=Klebsiella variicola TaxID=244366 RepID=UPI002405FFCC|nr:hypothetical protein [Klebsiella variicola]MDG0490086.1 hypothetical protein [Klebsiella variicola]
MAYSRDQLMGALRNADAAGDTEGARRIAAMIQSNGAATAAPQSDHFWNNPDNQMSYAATHAEPWENLGNSLATGVSKWLLTDHSTGKAATPTGAASDWYTRQMANPEIAHNADVVSKEVPRALAYGGAAALTEGAAVPVMEAAGFSSPLLTTIGANAVGSMAGQKAAGEDISLNRTAEDAALGVAFHSLGGLAKAGYKTLRNVLPESIGGISQAERAAEAVNPDYLERVLQGGDQDAQSIYRTATTNQAGESILNPSQVFNPESRLGRSFIGQEQRDLQRGSGSQYAENLNIQRSGTPIESALTEADNGANVQESADNLINQFRAQSSDNYQIAKSSAQHLLDSANVSQLKMPETKAVAQQHLDTHAQTGVGLTAEGRRTLNNFTKAKIDNIDTLDEWKRQLSEKANKAYQNRDITTSKALRDTLNSLRGEADSVINSIDPNAGSLYREADQFHSQMAGDFGSNSPLSKIANTDNSVKANQVLLGSAGIAGREQGIRNAMSIDQAIRDAVNRQDLDPLVLDEYRAALGNAVRDQAYKTATMNDQFSPVKFANNLGRHSFQSNIAGEGGINSALADAARTAYTKEAVGPTLTDRLAPLASRLVGAGVGYVTDGAMGGFIGQELAGRTASVVPLLLEKVSNTAGRSKAMIDFVSVPENAQRVADILAARGSSIEQASPSQVSSIVKNLSSVGTSTVIGSNQPEEQAAPEPQPMQQEQSQAQPQQRAQAAKMPAPETFDKGLTNLYHALSDAETGSEVDPYVRTHAAEGNTASSAYGPAQITRDLMKDFVSKHSDTLTDEQKDYAKRFIKQGDRMLKADKNDPVYGYGAPGVLNSPEDRQMYDVVAQKILKSIVENNGNSFNKTVRAWRGKSDSSYAGKVRKSFVKRQQGWSKAATNQ